MPRVPDLGITIGLLPPGPTGSVLDVPGAGLGHATVWRDEPPPPAGRGTARTGVTVIDPGGDLFRFPVPAGGAVLNGAGECTGLLAAQEWGLAETPVFLTSTMQLGRVYDAACELLAGEQAAIGDEDVIIPIVAECDDSFLNENRRMQVQRDDVRDALAAARASAGAAPAGAAPAGRGATHEGAVGAGTGMTCLGYKGGIGTASRIVPDGATVGVVTLTNFGDRERLTVAGVPAGRLLPDPAAGASRPGPGPPGVSAVRPGPAGSCIVVVLTDGPLDAAACQRLARRAGLGLARAGSTAHHASGEIFLALATGLRAPRGAAPSRSPITGSALDDYFAAVVEATEEAVLNSLLQAGTVTGRDGHTSYGLPAGTLRALLGSTAAGGSAVAGRAAGSGAEQQGGAAMTGSGPPAAPRGPGADPYAWMRDKDQPAMREHLAAERAYYDQQTAPLRGLRENLYAELAARLPPAEESVRWRQGAFWYFTATVAGQQLEQFCRAASPDGPGEVLLDENLLLAEPAAAGRYAELGVREVSPDGRYLAYSVDFDGDEVYQLRIRDLAAGADLDERIERSYYGLAWATDSRSLLYVVTDEAYRPHQVWRHELGAAPGRDTLVYQEDDERFELTVRAARSGAWLLIETASRDTTETLLIPADDTGVAPFVIEPRRPGTEYYADHASGPDGGELYLVTNAGAAEFRLVRTSMGSGQAGWAEVIGPAGDTRLVRCDVFGRYLVVEQRHAAATQLRVVDRETGAQYLIGAGLIEARGPEQALALAVNEEYTAAAVTVRTESLTQPPSWHDVDLASGRWVLRKRQEVPGYDPARYVTERISASAADGTPIPVTVAYRRGLGRDGCGPALLYGYGAYEAPSWPEFAVTTPSLLDRGFVYAVAHVRGGGEGGRGWWAQGHLDRKRTTFTDFIAAADMLAAEGWAAPDRIVSRGLSAGGLLQGAVFSMAPQRWRAVVAEVPFVDVVTTMLDPSIPLTITEWDEWGDPRDPAMRAYLASYSPYDNVPAGPRPDLLVTGSLHDPRVLIHEPAKWVARLRATDTAGSRVLFRAELGAGAHVGPAGRYDQLRYEAEILAFILTAAGPPGASDDES